MQFLELTLPTIAENVALDEALLLEAEAHQTGEVLRFWESQDFAVIMGAGCKHADEVNEAQCQADGVPILRRSSGGGSVLLGPGCLCFSLILSYEGSPLLREIPFSNVYILEKHREVLSDLLPGIERAGTSDLAAAGLKFSGNSQQRKRNFLLHHGTILYDFDIAHIEQYLRMPSRQPNYRQGRDHNVFVRNLPADVADLKRRLKAAWAVESELTDWPASRVRELIEDKYSKLEWTRRR